MELIETQDLEKTYSLNEVDEAAHWLIEQCSEQAIWRFYGSMGAGKTTLIKSLCSQLGVEDDVSSPTYSIVNEYIGNEGKIYHFDFYRLNHVTEALEIGVEDYLYHGNRCFIEWPELVEELLPSNTPQIILSSVDEHTRILKLKK
jgi:tRNA threonylcarbamoyladenosine biosynthesis protein TsaE